MVRDQSSQRAVIWQSLVTKNGGVDGKVVWQTADAAGQILTECSPELCKQVDATDVHVGSWKEQREADELTKEPVRVAVHSFTMEQKV